MFLASDNTSGAAPGILAAIVAANDGYATSYGNDTLMADVRARLREVFEAPEAAIYLVATGTAANALALATLAPPWSAIYCHREAHVELDECNAPEFFTGGAKLTLIDGAHGKIDPEALAETLAGAAPAEVHHPQPGALSLTNVTELGGVYTPDEIARLTALARARGLPCHLDGARFANALVATGATPAEMTWKAGIDAVSFGGTKNGCLGVEAVILFDPAKAWEFELRRKRGAHLFSKHRFLSAQMAAYLDGGLWLDLAHRANAAAARLAVGLGALPGVRLVHPVEANMIFAALPRAMRDAARAAGAAFHDWADADGPAPQARLVCSWSTTEADIAAFLAACRT